jgi:hypothetical protein
MNFMAILTFTICAVVLILALAAIWIAVEKALGVTDRSVQPTPAGPMRNQDAIDQG